MKAKAKTTALDFEALPGHYIRRLQQIAVAVFLQATEAHGVTPVQYAALNQVARTPGVDQQRRWHSPTLAVAQKFQLALSIDSRCPPRNSSRNFQHGHCLVEYL